jgi:flagellar hook-basal body complex protein FliE
MLGAMEQIASVVAGKAPGLDGIGLEMQRPGDGYSDTRKTPFADLMTEAVGNVARLQDEAQQAMVGLMTGSGVDVHQAMIATEKASMAFELSLAVRNKAIQAYQQVMGMQF